MRIVPWLSVRAVRLFFNTRYRLAAMTKRSRIMNRVVKKVMFDEDEIIVVPKDNVVRRVIETDIEIDSPGDTTVLPSDVVKAVIDRADDIFIMNFCICRRSNSCDDYPRDHGCVFLGKGVHRIPKEYGHMATGEEAKAYIDECRGLGLVQIIGRNKTDSMWLATGDKRDLMTICNCCPCCCLWNMTRNISDDIGSVFRRMDGVSVSIDTERCVGCGSCAGICFTKAIAIGDGKAFLDQHLCRGCGRCAETCPADAISLTYDEGAIEGVVERVSSLVRLSGGQGAE